MNNYLICIRFNGTNFYGTQKQEELPTIQGLFEELISKYLDSTTKVTNCSRLDRGVHAENFYMNFRTEKTVDLYKFKYYLNCSTPEDVEIKSVSEIDPEFSSRYHAQKKTYEYTFSFNPKEVFESQFITVSKYPKKVDITKVDYKQLEGEHDFVNFSSDDDATSFVNRIKKVDVSFNETNNHLKITVEAKMFFRYQVRYMAGIIYEIICGRKTNADLAEMLQPTLYTKPRYLPPAKGLKLVSVNYEKEE